MNDLTQIIAQYVGPVLFVAGVSMLANKKFFISMLKDMEKSKTALFFAGIVSIVAGFAVVLNHFIFDTFAAGFISILGLLMLTKGLFIVLMPNKVFFIIKHYLKYIKKYLVFDALIAIALGLYVIKIGFFC